MGLAVAACCDTSCCSSGLSGDIIHLLFDITCAISAQQEDLLLDAAEQPWTLAMRASVTA